MDLVDQYDKFYAKTELLAENLVDLKMNGWPKDRTEAIIFSVKLILIEIANLLSVSNYAKQLNWLEQLIRKLTGSEVKESEINEELVNILQMLSIMIISLCSKRYD
mgnify:CR=1 FL=1